MAESFADLLARNYALMGANATENNQATLSGYGTDVSHAQANANWQPTASAQAAVSQQFPNVQQPMQSPMQPQPMWAQQYGAYGGMGVPVANDPNGGGNMANGMGNPYLQGQVDYFGQQYDKQLQKGLQGIRSSAVGVGGLGGSRMAIAEGEAIGNSQNAYAGNLSNFLSGNYRDDRQLNTNSANTNRQLDLSQAGLGLQALQVGQNLPWTPIQNANQSYGTYTGLGSQTTGAQGSSWQGALGGALAGGSFGRQQGWW